MPEVLYEDKVGETRSAKMFSPKLIQEPSRWFKEARKVIPTIPNPETSDWRIVETTIEVRWITFTLVNSVNERARIIIDRTKPALGIL